MVLHFFKETEAGRMIQGPAQIELVPSQKFPGMFGTSRGSVSLELQPLKQDAPGMLMLFLQNQAQTGTYHLPHGHTVPCHDLSSQV